MSGYVLLVVSFLLHYFSNELGGSNSFWIGLNDIQQEGVFQWIDGTQFRYSLDNNTNQNHGISDGSGVSPSTEPSTTLNYVYNHDAELDFSMWHNEEPNNGGSKLNEEDCVQIRRFDGSWNDYNCAYRGKYICEKEANEEGTLAETTIKCPHSFETVIELGAHKTVTWSEPAYLADSLASHIERSHSPGAEFRIGVTWVNYTFRDPYNNTATCNFSVAVLEVDTTPPKITLCPPDVIVTKITDVPLTVTWESPVATDLSGSVTLVSQSHFPSDEFELGLNNVTYKFSDASGNEALCFFNIYVFDVDNPLESPLNAGTYVAHNGLFTGLYIILTFIGVALAVVLLKLFRTKSDSGVGKLFYARMNGDADVDIGI